AAAVCAIEMARQHAVLEAQLHLRGNFVEELLTNGYHSIGAMRQRARFLGHDLDQPHAVAMLDFDHFAQYIAARPVSGEGGLATCGPGATTPFDKLGVYRLLFRLRESPELDAFCDELLGPLERYDKARGTDLVHTLECYLACNCNVARATEELHLHRNGLLY